MTAPPKKRDHLFKKGESGNPAGRRPGSLDWRAKLRKEIEAHTPGIVATLAEQAMAGDTSAARLLLERALPPLRAQSQPLALAASDIPRASNLSEAAVAVFHLAAEGKISVEEATGLLTALGGVAKIREVDDLVSKVASLEEIVCGSNRPAHRVLLDEQHPVYGASDDDGLDVH